MLIPILAALASITCLAALTLVATSNVQATYREQYTSTGRLYYACSLQYFIAGRLIYQTPYQT